MTGTKVLLILLILIVVLFIVLIVWGIYTNVPPSTDDPVAELNKKPHPVISKFADLLGSPSPKLKPTELTPNPQPLRRAQPGIRVPAGKFILRFGDQPTVFDISPDSAHQLRRATFTETRQGCATIEYKSDNGSGSDLKLDLQHWPTNPKTPESTRDPNPTRATFQVLSGKGHLTIALGTPDCAVQLE